MYVCMYVCTYVCMYVHNIHKYIHTHAYIYTYVYIYIFESNLQVVKCALPDCAAGETITVPPGQCCLICGKVL